MAWIVLGLWLGSVGSGLVDQGKTVFGQPPGPSLPSHPEIPGENPAALLTVLETCTVQVRPPATLVLVVSDNVPEPDRSFLFYRLAYLLYPVAVRKVGEDAGPAIDQAAAEGPEFILVFGNQGKWPPGYQPIGPPGGAGSLFRRERGGAN